MKLTPAVKVAAPSLPAPDVPPVEILNDSETVTWMRWATLQVPPVPTLQVMSSETKYYS